MNAIYAIWSNPTSRNRVLLVSVSTVIVVIGLAQLINDEDQHPCGAKKYPGRCYRIERQICESTWEKSERECEEQIKNLSLPPTRLTGPILTNCQLTKLDKVFNYLRVTNPDCNERHSQLESWMKTNPQF